MIDNSIKPKKKSIVKKLLIGLGLFFITIIILVILLPYFFKDDIIAFVKNELNNAVETKIDFKDIDVSLIKHFPNFNANIAEFSVLGKGGNKNLINADEISLDMDILSVISSSKPIEIIDFSIIRPKINILIDENGNSNYNIIKETSSNNSSGETFQLRDLKLEKYNISEAEIIFEDLKSNKNLHINNLNHTGSGNFNDIIFKLKTTTTIDKVNLVIDGIPYLKNTKLDWNINFDADINKMLFIIKENTINLNELKLTTKGQLAISDEFIDMDISLNAPGNNFKEIFSMVPNAYTKDYQNVKAKGDFKMEGKIKGKYYFDKDFYPDFNFKLLTKNGYIKYPDLSLPINNINCDIQIKKEGSSLNNTIVNINPLNFSIEKEQMSMTTNLKNILSDPLSSGKFRGTLDLDALSKAFPLDDILLIKGKLKTNLSYKFNQSLTTKELTGIANANNINIKYSTFPSVKINTANANFTTDKIDINNLVMNIGNSDIAGNISINDPLNYFTKDQTISVGIDGKSNLFDINEWISNESNNQKSSNTNNEISKNDPTTLNFIKNRLSINYNYSISQLIYDDYDIKNMIINGKYNNNNLNINNQSFYFSGSKLNINGNLKKIVSWLMEEKTLVGYLNLTSTHFDMDKYMSDEGDQTKNKSETTSTPFELPDKMDIIVNTNISNLNYTGKVLSKLNGKLHLKDKTLNFNNFRANGMGGSMKFDGIISTPINKKPIFDINYSLEKMKYEELYKSVITLKSLAPISKFVKGVLNANFSFKGTMSKDFTPELSSINATGLIHTLNAYINDYPGLNDLASKLQVQSLKKIKIEDSKNTFEIIDGALEVKPFDVKYDNMKFNISGTNKLDKTIDYIVHANIPRDKIGKIPGGKSLNKGLDFIIQKAQSKGLDVKVGEILNMDFLVSGAFNKPKIKINFLGTQSADGTTSDNTKVVEKIKTKADKKIQTTKNKVKDKVNKTVDSSKKVVKKKVDETTSKLKNKAEEQLENIIDSTTKSKAEKGLKDALKNLNPFKKKKK